LKQTRARKRRAISHRAGSGRRVRVLLFILFLILICGSSSGRLRGRL
jgi:hypothetical protein